MKNIKVRDFFSTHNGEIVEVLAYNEHKDNPFKLLCKVTRKCNLSPLSKKKPDIVRYYSPSGVSEFGSGKLNMASKVFTEEEKLLSLSFLV